MVCLDSDICSLNMSLIIEAEDFYGNDYPEDEIDSDDEVGIGVYNHRNRGSDEEEFGEGIDQWSDEEDEAYPWKRNP